MNGWTTQQSHYIRIFFRHQAGSHAKFIVENDNEDKKGLRSGNLRLHDATTWRHFRFILIGVFYPFLASFVDQRNLFSLHNNYKMILMIIKVYGAEICVFMARLLIF